MENKEFDEIIKDPQHFSYSENRLLSVELHEVLKSLFDAEELDISELYETFLNGNLITNRLTWLEAEMKLLFNQRKSLSPQVEENAKRTMESIEKSIKFEIAQLDPLAAQHPGNMLFSLLEALREDVVYDFTQYERLDRELYRQHLNITVRLRQLNLEYFSLKVKSELLRRYFKTLLFAYDNDESRMKQAFEKEFTEESGAQESGVLEIKEIPIYFSSFFFPTAMIVY